MNLGLLTILFFISLFFPALSEPGRTNAFSALFSWEKWIFEIRTSLELKTGTKNCQRQMAKKRLKNM